MAPSLKGKRVAILAANGFEESELTKPRKALDDAGAKTTVVSPEKGKVKGWAMTDWGQEVSVDQPLDSADPAQFDALLLPGGVMNPDHLRMNPKAIEFVSAFGQAGKPIAAICHGPWTLIEAGLAEGRRMTSYASIQSDLKNAGADWVDEETVIDGGILTSRQPDDIPAFNAKMIEFFANGAKSSAEAAA